VADPKALTLFPVAAITPVNDLRSGRIVPENFGNDILFNAARQLLLAVSMPDDTTRTITVDYRIGVLEREGHPAPPLASDSACILPVLRGYALRPSGESGTASYTFVADPGSRTGYVAVPLRTAHLPLRTYSLALQARAGAAHATTTLTFRNVWPGMPRSLKNIDTAIDALRLIAAEASLDSMQSGDFNERRDALERFWAQKDPTPGTIYNEAMTEFYRRVDHARTAYATMQEPDGVRSDRGRIYILNGQPTRVDRTLNPSVGYTEIWTYEKTNRTFTFVDERRNGTYKLAVSKK
jgi:GWxTD domain-containing protein